MNCNAQCRTCNRFDEGEKDKYREYLEGVHGKDKIALLDFEKTQIKKWHPFELELLIMHYKGEVKNLKALRGCDE